MCTMIRVSFMFCECLYLCAQCYCDRLCVWRVTRYFFRWMKNQTKRLQCSVPMIVPQPKNIVTCLMYTNEKLLHSVQNLHLRWQHVSHPTIRNPMVPSCILLWPAWWKSAMDSSYRDACTNGFPYHSAGRRQPLPDGWEELCVLRIQHEY